MRICSSIYVHVSCLHELISNFRGGFVNTFPPVSFFFNKSQSVAASRDSTSSLLKRPKVQGNPSPVSITSAKRVSMGGSLVKMEKDNVKNTAGNKKIPFSLIIFYFNTLVFHPVLDLSSN